MSNDTGTLTLTEFLLARIADDEAVARANVGTFPTPTVFDDGGVALHIQYGGNAVITWYRDPVAGYCDMAALRRWANADGWHSARVLSECEAKRRIVETVAPYSCKPDVAPGASREDSVLAYLVAVYADHPDFREEWRA